MRERTTASTLLGASDVRLGRALTAPCITQITSWGVLYYAFPVLLSSLTSETGWSLAQALGAFSTSALVSSVGAVPVGRLIDRCGPRPVMTTGSVFAVLAVTAIALAPSLSWFYLAFALPGVAQAATLYPPAFAALTGWYPESGRVRALTAVTLVGGLSSTVFALLTALLVIQLGWRHSYLVLAGVLLVVTVPLHALCLTPRWPGRRRTGSSARARDWPPTHPRPASRGSAGGGGDDRVQRAAVEPVRARAGVRVGGNDAVQRGRPVSTRPGWVIAPGWSSSRLRPAAPTCSGMATQASATSADPPLPPRTSSRPRCRPVHGCVRR